MATSPLKQLLDTGIYLTDLSKKQADSVVKNLVKSGELRRKEAEELVQGLVIRSREASERLGQQMHEELSSQIALLASRFEDLEAVLQTVARQLGVRHESGAGASSDLEAPETTKPLAEAQPERVRAQPPAKKAPRKKSAAKKAPAAKASARKTAAKRAPGRKAPAKRAPAKKASKKRSSATTATTSTSRSKSQVAARKPRGNVSQ